MIHRSRARIEPGMKMLIQILLLALLVGCASPYYPVYVNNEGDYYIAERVTNGAYYDTTSMVLADIGTYPWWISGYPPPLFVIYSPYYYPYYFSIWHPHGHYPYYAWHGGYGAYPGPSYRYPGHHGNNSRGRIVTSPARTQSAPAFTRSPAQPSMTARPTGSSRSSGFSRPSIGSSTPARSPKLSTPAPALDKQ